MSRAMTAQELAYIRSSGQYSRLYLAFRLPTTIYTAQVDGIPVGDNANFPDDMVGELAFDNGAGTLGNVKTGMTVWVGSTAGAKDLGMCYIRKPPIAGTMYVGETSEIDWANDVHLTVVDDYQIWARHIKIVSGSPVMDFDIAYSDQHTDFDPIVNMGGDIVLWRTAATVSFQWDASGSSVFGDTISAYLWTAPGASATSGTTTATPTITYATDGQYCVYCAITTNNGKTFEGVRIVYVFSDDNPPETDFTLASCSINFEDGGCRFEVEMSSDCDLTEVHDRTKVILFAKDYYGGVEVSIGPETGRENIIAQGWITGESIQWSPNVDMIRFSVAGGQEWLKRISSFPVGVEMANPATAWTNMAGLTVDRVVWHLLHWRTTYSKIGDINLTGNSLYAAELVGATASIWEQIRQIAFTSIFATCGIDQFGSFHLIVEPQLVPEADRSGWPTIQTITEADWHDSLDITRYIVTESSMVSTSGVVVNATGKGSALFSLANGHVFKHYGMPEVLDRLLLEDQDQANEQAGLYIAWRNKPYDFVISLASNHRMTTLWPAQRYAITIAAADTERGFSYAGNLIPRRVEYQYDDSSRTLLTDLYLEPEITADLNMDGDIPVGDGTFLEFPPLPRLPKLPPLPPLDLFLPEIVPVAGGPNKILLSTQDYGFVYTENGNDSSPNWYSMNTGLTTDQMNNVKLLFKCPNGSLWCLVAVGIGGGDSVHFAEGLGFPWQEIFTSTSDIAGLGVNPDVEEEVIMVYGSKGAMNINMGDRNGITFKTSGLDSEVFIGEIVYNQGKFVFQHAEDNIFDSQALSRFSSVGAIEVNTYNPALGQNYSACEHRGKAGGNFVYTWNANGTYIRKITDYNLATSNTTQPNVGALGTVLQNMLDCDPTGQYLMGGNSTAQAKKSNDYGVNWTTVSALASGYLAFENCGTPDTWLACKNSLVQYTPDFGVTWVNKTGDFATLFTSPDPRLILCVDW